MIMWAFPGLCPTDTTPASPRTPSSRRRSASSSSVSCRCRTTSFRFELIMASLETGMMVLFIVGAPESGHAPRFAGGNRRPDVRPFARGGDDRQHTPHHRGAFTHRQEPQSGCREPRGIEAGTIVGHAEHDGLVE